MKRVVFAGCLLVLLLVGCVPIINDAVTNDVADAVTDPIEKEENSKNISNATISGEKTESVEEIQPGWSKSVTVTKTAIQLLISSNGIPSHPVGTFPVMIDTNADGRPDNPNTVKTQAYKYKIPLIPQKASSATSLPMGPIGIALSGAVFFNPQNAEKQDAVQVEVFDMCQGHPEMQGRYHYHELSSCFEIGSEGHSFLIGYAFDGFGIYGPYEDTNKIPTDLDACNGHEHGLIGYHYHVTKKYPYILGCYTGIVESSNLDQAAMKNTGGHINGDQMPPIRDSQSPPGVPPLQGPPTQKT